MFVSVTLPRSVFSLPDLYPFPLIKVAKVSKSISRLYESPLSYCICFPIVFGLVGNNGTLLSKKHSGFISIHNIRRNRNSFMIIAKK